MVEEILPNSDSEHCIMSEKPKTPEEIFNDDSDEDQFIDAIEREGNEGRTGDFEVEKEKIEGVDSGGPHGERGAHAMGEADNSDEDSPNGPEHEDAELARRKAKEDEMSDEERQKLKDAALKLKAEGNEFYLKDRNDDATRKYSEALEMCPLCFKKERAVFFANRAAAKCKMGTRESALEDCSSAIELNPIYVKALSRRGQLYEDLDKPHEAMKDFNRVLDMDKSHTEANKAAMRLPPKIARKDEELKKEMMGNLKKLGNMVLNPFGLSTENFDFQQDPSTGNYTVNFQNKK